MTSNQIDQLAQFELEKRKLDIQKGLMVKSWMESNDPDQILKAQMYLEDVEKRKASGVKSVMFDPDGRSQGNGYKQKLVPLTYATLRAMGKTPIISAIIKTRVEQISEFTTPQTSKFQPGFVIRKKRKNYFSDEKEKNSAQDDKAINDMTESILNCGSDYNAWHGDSLDSLTRKFIPDSLALDQGTFEVIRNRKGIPIEMMAVDGATVRVADSIDDDEYKGSRKQVNGYYPSYVQVLDQNIKNEYYPWELCFGVRNPSSNIYNNGYGNSELEELMNVVTWMLNSDSYNGKFFSQGSSPKGILKVSGNVNAARLKEFRQEWHSTTSSVMNAHKVPIIDGENVDFINLQSSNRDMEFSQWQEYLIKVSCALYKIDPTEIFDFVNSKPGFNGENTEEKVKYSRDKGLKPLLRSFQTWLNKYWVNPRNPELELIFVGLDTDSEQKELELDIKRGQSFMGMNELREKHDLGDLDEKDMVLNPVWMQMKQMEAMEGAPGEPPGEFTPEADPIAAREAELTEYEKSKEINPFIQELNDFTEKSLGADPKITI